MWDRIEDIFLIKGMRIAGSIIATIFVIVIFALIWPQSKPQNISYTTIKEALAENETSNKKQGDYKRPEVLSEENLGEGNYKVVNGWIDNIPNKYKQSYADTLANIYGQAIENGDNAPDILNKYKELQNERIMKIAAIDNDTMARNIKYLFAMGMFLGLVLVCNLLVLIKIAKQ